MSVPVNLYVDRMSPVEPVRVADVYAVTSDRASAYSEAAAKIGLTTREYAEFRQALTEGGAVYVRLPRHIDAMAGIHRRNGHVYALRNVLVPSGTMGWQVNLADGTTVLVPRICGNLSMNRSRAIAATKPRQVALRTQPKAVRAATFVAPKVAAAAPAAPETPVTFDTPPAAAPAGGPATVASIGSPASVVGTAVRHGALLPFLGLLFPVVSAAAHGGAPTSSGPEAPPCSQGSNAMGVCQK